MSKVSRKDGGRVGRCGALSASTLDKHLRSV